MNCEGAKALLTALIRAFTQYSTIKKYTEACSGTGDLPKCYVRLDAAHFVKLYVEFLSKQTPLRKVKFCYKASIGQLILSRDLETARKILKAILVASQCETDGCIVDTNIKTQCEQQRSFLKCFIDPRELGDTHQNSSPRKLLPVVQKMRVF